jgi:hypothetical protein
MLENIREEHYSRNRRVMQVLKLLRFVEEHGEGAGGPVAKDDPLLRRASGSCRSPGGRKPATVTTTRGRWTGCT